MLVIRMIRPRIRPAMTSVSQWTRRYTLEKLMVAMIRVAISAVVIFVSLGLFFVNMYAISPKNTIAIVAWPLGSEKPVSRIIGFDGRATCSSSFAALIIAAVIRIVAVRKMACFFWDLWRR